MRTVNDCRGMRAVMGLPDGMEWLLILVVVVLVFGSGKLSEVGGALGKSIREFREEKDKPTMKDTRGTTELSVADSQEENSPRQAEQVESGAYTKRDNGSLGPE
jgi:sec-independent protein translocase protein TatA